MKEQNNLYEDFEEYLIEEEKKLDIIYKELLENNENKNSIKKFERIVKSKIDYRGLLPCSKSYEGESLLTLSKTWMILILIKITKGKAQKDQFLLLVNSSLTHELNEYNEYKDFYIEQCELLFSDDEALRQINLNPKTPKKIDNSIEHEELKNYYIYLLFRPKYFQKTDLDGMEKIKKSNQKEEKNDKKRKSINEKNKKYKKKIENMFDLKGEEEIKNLIKKNKISENNSKKLKSTDLIKQKMNKMEERFEIEKYRRETAIMKSMDTFQKKINRFLLYKEDKEYNVKE